MGEPVSEFYATVTTGQAVLIAVGVFLGLQLLGEVVDVVRRILGRPVELDVDIEQLVEEIGRLRDVVEAVGHDQLGELERIRESIERVDEVLGAVEDGALGVTRHDRHLGTSRPSAGQVVAVEALPGPAPWAARPGIVLAAAAAALIRRLLDGRRGGAR